MPEKCKDKAADEKIILTDTDSRFMKNCGKIIPSYNVQVASSKGFILAADIAGNNAGNDQHELLAILDQVKQNSGKRIETTLNLMANLSIACVVPFGACKSRQSTKIRAILWS